MKRSDKALLCIVSLIGLGLSVCLLALFYPIPFVTDAFKAFPWLTNVVTGFSVFLCLGFCVLLLAALFFPRSNDLIIVKDKGKLTFSKQTVESTVRYSFADTEGISSCRVRAKIYGQPEKTRIYVKLTLNDPDKMIGLTETVQEQIESAMKSSLGITVRAIDIKVAEFSRENKDRAENDAAKGGRVV